MNSSIIRRRGLRQNSLSLPSINGGVCRSEKILEDEPFGLKDLIDDCENLRQQLGVKQWSVIGHSFGGYLALIYAAGHPDSVANVIFECPTFDFTWTAQSLLTKAASIFKTLGDAERSEQCLHLAASNLSARELFDRYMQFGEDLGEKKELIYSPYETLTDDSLYTEEEWDEFGEKTDIHLSRLREEGKIFESAVPLLSRLSVPSLLILGKHDPVTCERHIRAYKDAAQGETIVMKGCGHTPHKEQPALYRDTVSNFILASTF
ncbi:alpha/beta hydrolase [Paenibacillus oralis]|uniref:alpha/beta fold hydrolase n=1 Tax=Paenibacillus oralis TaxID=2490856 RepID=UPI00319E561B